MPPDSDIKEAGASKQAEKAEESEEEIGYVGYVGRTASGMIRDMFTPHGSFSSSSVNGAEKMVPLSPSSTSISSASNDSVLASPERTIAASGESPSGWRIPREIYECQEELVGTREALSSDEEREGEGEGSDTEGCSSISSLRSQNSLFRNSVASNSSISSAGTSASDEGPSGRTEMFSRSLVSRNSVISLVSPSTSKKALKMFYRSKEAKSEPDVFLQSCNLGNGPKTQKVPFHGSVNTLNRTPKKSKLKGRRRISLKPSKSRPNNIEATISSPAILDSGSGSGPGDGGLTRQIAIRGKRGTRIERNVSQTIPETSYSFEVSKVKVFFKSAELEVTCRGKHCTELH